MIDTVYFIEAGGTSRIKVGKSVHPERRLAQLQTGSTAPLRILATVQADERELHAFFWPFRLRGEWFQRNPALEAMIQHVQEHRSLPPREDWAATFDFSRAIQEMQ